MRTSVRALSIGVATASLIACSGEQPPVGAPGALPQSHAIAPTRVIAHRSVPAPSYQVLYSFIGGSDGGYPAAALINVNGTLYGTTERGGGSGCYKNFGCGTVYSITPSGSEKVLHRFTGGSDGADPAAALINVNGTLYGTTVNGGAYNKCQSGCGTVFSITPGGTEKVLHSFSGPPDGAYPVAALINVNGILYGTTAVGGNSGGCHLGREKIGCGTVYSISTSGSETVLHRFTLGSDGVNPATGLVDVNGTLYGTTVHYYGNGSADRPARGGSVYSISTSGSEKVLYRFAGEPDGESPHAGLIDVQGTLYSTTLDGGKSCDPYESSGCGTAYRITTSGTEKVLYRFVGHPSDGSSPSGDLIKVNGTLYGTTAQGGAYCSSAPAPYCGTVFSVTTSGTEKVLHSFGSRSDGSSPVAGLINVKGTYYGTTTAGGAYGWGTVFALTP